MSDYIKRENALNAFNNAFYAGLTAKINKIPSEDVEPVVRCKDCDYWNELEKGVGVCKRLVEAMWVDYTDFCSFAENKDDITYGEREDDEQERD